MRHGHSHGDSKSSGDSLTILGTLIGGITDTAASYYYFSQLVSLLDGSEDSDSTPARIVGSLAALLSLTSMYTHYKLNKFHQMRSQQRQEEIDQNPPAPEVQPSNQEGSLNSENRSLLEHPILSDGSDEHKHPHLNKTQKVALGLDGLTHAAGSAGTLVALFNGVLGRVGFWSRVGVHVASLGLGVVGALADVRNEADALRAENPEEASHRRP